ncbi:DUF3892 domain-containing protein [Clavibacter nebraskensis]|uniref:DUF3892 domain-containing protein n=1 Tax=Clavibacter nebraskensis TaxID=31963 RepID=UPI00200C55B5|nr:DUF3892 domain-containing protein [Clavibacter nebraskensis]UQB14592.1 DUF3892 domain-containing protein [Clavibacter nebraskensis]UQB17424.1 DUF3892 domain-containing protein [Clavibacter nebraskensis]
MADYAVTGVTKDDDGDIVEVCGPWGKVSLVTAVQLLRIGSTFYVPLKNNRRADITEVRGTNRPYLRTNWDGTTKNNLEELDPC